MRTCQGWSASLDLLLLSDRLSSPVLVSVSQKIDKISGLGAGYSCAVEGGFGRDVVATCFPSVTLIFFFTTHFPFGYLALIFSSAFSVEESELYYIYNCCNYIFYMWILKYFYLIASFYGILSIGGYVYMHCTECRYCFKKVAWEKGQALHYQPNIGDKTKLEM